MPLWEDDAEVGGVPGEEHLRVNDQSGTQCRDAEDDTHSYYI